MSDEAVKLSRLRGKQDRITGSIAARIFIDYFFALIRRCFRYRTVALLTVALLILARVAFVLFSNFQSEIDVCPIPMDKLYIRGQLFDGSRNKKASLFQMPSDDYFQVSETYLRGAILMDFAGVESLLLVLSGSTGREEDRDSETHP